MADGQEVLHELVANVLKEQGYENCQISTEQISTDGANYTSFLYRVTLSTPNKDDLKLFVKIAAAGEKMRSVAPFRIFEIENFAYNRLLKTYRELEEKHSVPVEHRLVTPQFYGSSDEYLREGLVLEDLEASGYTAFNRFTSIDWEYASKSVQNLAKLHALSIAWSIEDPASFEETETIKIDANLNSLMDYLNSIVDGAIAVTREENKERLSTFAKELMANKDMGKFYKPMRRPVIAHGDYRPSNLMHKVDKDGSVQIISVDYQTLQQGNPILDLMYLIFTGSDKNFRSKYYKQTLDNYYTELCAVLRRLHLDPDEIYPREDFEYELEQILPFGLLVALFCLLLVTVDVEDAPKVSKDITFTDFAFNPSTLYKERLNDIIDDYVEMGIL